MKSICLFNHKGGVSKTTTSFNIGWSLAESGKKVLMIDLDSQCNLSGLVLGFGAIDDDYLELFYSNREHLTMKPIVEYLINGGQPESYLTHETGKIYKTKNENLFLLPGHLDVSDLDSQISVSLKIASGIPATKNIPGNLPKLLQTIAINNRIDYVIYDLSPNVGGLNEVILMSSDYFIVPASPDFFCLQAIASLSKNILKWHKELKRFKEDNQFDIPSYPIKNAPLFIGAIQQRYRPRNDHPSKSFDNWINRIRNLINTNFIPSLTSIGCAISPEQISKILENSGLEPYDLAHIPDFNSLIAISQQLSKPIFSLTDEEIKEHGKVFGHAAETMFESRNKFLVIFNDLAKKVLLLTA